jgi:hypothetical protein
MTRLTSWNLKMMNLPPGKTGIHFTILLLLLLLHTL